MSAKEAGHTECASQVEQIRRQAGPRGAPAQGEWSEPAGHKLARQVGGFRKPETSEVLLPDDSLLESWAAGFTDRTVAPAFRRVLPIKGYFHGEFADGTAAQAIT